jgi:hypothetical protein
MSKIILREEKFKKVIEYSPGKIVDNMLFEQGQNNTYLLYDLVEKKFVIPKDPDKVWNQLETDNIIYKPLPDLPWKPLPMSGYSKGYEEVEDLSNEIEAYIKAHIDFSEPFQYTIASDWVKHTWRMENWRSTPYLFFYGPADSGKTWTMEVLASICFRPILCTSTTSASLFRIAEKFCPTLFLDEIQLYSQDEKAEIIALLNSGYRRGQVAIRTRINRDGNDELIFL